MALETVKRNLVRRVVGAFRDYAASQGWRPEDYRIYVWPNLDWFSVHVILAVKSLPERNAEDSTFAAIDFVHDKLKDDPDLARSIGLTVRTFDQIEQGGLYGIAPDFVEADDL